MATTLKGGGKIPSVATNTVARTDTAAKNLFTLPAGAIPFRLTITSPAVSNAGTTATLNVGKTGAPTQFLNAFDVKGATGSGQQLPAALNLGASVGASDIVVTGTYAETGAASNAGGPWTVIMEYFDP